MLKSIKFTAQTAWPADREKKPGEQMLDGMDWAQHITLDVVPRVGDLVNIGGEYLPVEQVYINPGDDGTSTIDVHLDGDTIVDFSHAGMTAGGWRED